MGKFLGLGAKSGCGFFIPKSKMASKMAAKKMNFLFFTMKELRLRKACRFLCFFSSKVTYKAYPASSIFFSDSFFY